MFSCPLYVILTLWSILCGHNLGVRLYEYQTLFERNRSACHIIYTIHYMYHTLMCIHRTVIFKLVSGTIEKQHRDSLQAQLMRIEHIEQKVAIRLLLIDIVLELVVVSQEHLQEPRFLPPHLCLEKKHD